MGKKFAIGVDFGATQIKVGIVSSLGKVLSKRVIPTPKDIAPEKFVLTVKNEIQSLLSNSLSRGKCIGIGIGVPGLVNHHRGVVHYLVNVKGWKDVPVAQFLGRQLKSSVWVDNDVNVMTLGEFVFGAGRECQDLICLTLGTGVGGGMIISGRLYRGSSGWAGEIGHMAIVENGRLCACGGVGCLEAYVGNQRVIELALHKLQKQSRHEKASLLQRWIAVGESLTPQLITQAAHRRDSIAISVWKEIGIHLGVALASVVNLLNPQRIVIGGGVANAGSLLFDAVRQTVKKRAMKGPADSVRIVKAQLGENAGIVGAAVLAGIKGK